MKLEGSCHCGAVRFSVESSTPYPYMHCYCSICRKTAGGGGYAINIMGEAATLRIEGDGNITVYQISGGEGKRHFCRHCGSALYASNPRWGDWVYPFASAIDTPLPPAPERTHIMLDFKAPWVAVPEGKQDPHFPQYPDQSIADWHKSRSLTDEE